MAIVTPSWYSLLVFFPVSHPFSHQALLLGVNSLKCYAIVSLRLFRKPLKCCKESDAGKSPLRQSSEWHFQPAGLLSVSGRKADVTLRTPQNLYLLESVQATILLDPLGTYHHDYQMEENSILKLLQ